MLGRAVLGSSLGVISTTSNTVKTFGCGSRSIATGEAPQCATATSRVDTGMVTVMANWACGMHAQAHAPRYGLRMILAQWMHSRTQPDPYGP
jgi:hypothetical protein